MSNPPGPTDHPSPIDRSSPTEAELARMRAEIAVLHARLDTRSSRRDRGRSARRITAAVLVVVTAFAVVAAVVGVWGARTVLSTDRWVATVAPLPSDPQVSAAVSSYATAQLFEVVDVERRLRDVLPQQAAFAAGPIASRVRDSVRQTVTTVLESERFRAVWIELNRRLHPRLLAVLDGTSDVVTAQQDQVRIDLLPLINQVLRELSAQLPTLFGKQLDLPDLGSGAVPADLRVRVQDALGVTLPANFAQFTVYDSGRLTAVQDAVASARRDLTVLVVASIALLLLSYLVSPGRRRTTVQLGLALVLAAVTVTAVLRVVRRELLSAVPAGVYRDGAAAAATSIFGPLRERGVQILWIGAALALLAYLAGPGRLPVRARGLVARGARALGSAAVRTARVVRTRGPGFVAAHADPLRVAGLVVGVLLALLLSSWTALAVLVVLVVAFELAVTVIARRGPAAHLIRPA
jgi:hypothetical protein